MGATEVANEEFEDTTRKERFARYGAMPLGVCTIYQLTTGSASSSLRNWPEGARHS